MANMSRPGRASIPGEVEFLEVAETAAAADLSELTTTHRQAGYVATEKPSYKEWNYRLSKLAAWVFRRLGAATLLAERREATITVAGTVDTGDVRRFTFDFGGGPTQVDYSTQASDTTNAQIAAGWIKVFNETPTVSRWVRAVVDDTTAEVIHVYAVHPGQAVAWSTSIPVDVGTADATAVLAEVVAGDLYVRIADDDNWDSLGLLVGSNSPDDIGPDGDDRLLFDKSKGAFRAGSATGAEWNDASRGLASIGLGRNTTASGSAALAGGDGSLASGAAAIALGYGAQATGARSVALGSGLAASIAAAADSVALAGGNVQVGANGGVAIGGVSNAAVVQGVGGVAIGDETLAAGDYSTAIGRDCSTAAGEGVSIGSGSGVQPNASEAAGAIAIGKACRARGVNSYTLGTWQDASGANAVAIGYGISGGAQLASGARAVAIGNRNTVQNADAWGVGRQNTVAGDDSGALGFNNAIGAATSFALGDSNDVQFGNCYVIGQRNIPSAAQGIAIGRDNLPGTGAFALGTGNVPSGSQSLAFGHDCTPTGTQAIAIGYACQATTNNAIGIGDEAKAPWPSSIAYNSGGKHTAVGDVRGHFSVLDRKTTTAAPTAMNTGGVADRLTLLDSTTYTYTARVAAYCTGGAGGNVDKGFGAELRGAIRVNGASAVLSLGTTLQTWDAEALGYTVTIDVTAARFRIVVTGGATDDVSWTATLHVAECGGSR